MRRTLILSFLVAFVALTGVGQVRTAHATEVGYSRKLGLGLMLGDNTGFTGKFWVGPTNAIDFGLGFYSVGWGNRCYTDQGGTHCNNYTAYTLVGDYLWQANIVRGTAQLDWHLGVGGKFTGGNYWDYNHGSHGWNMGPRGLIGLDLMFQNPSFLEIFLEVSPVLFLFDTAFFMDADVGVRFFF